MAVKCYLTGEIVVVEWATVIGRDGRERCWAAIVAPTLADEGEFSRRGATKPAARTHCDNLEPELETDPFGTTDDVVLGPLRGAFHPVPERFAAAHQAELIVSYRLDSPSVIRHVAPLGIGFHAGIPRRGLLGQQVAVSARSAQLSRFWRKGDGDTFQDISSGPRDGTSNVALLPLEATKRSSERPGEPKTAST